MFLGVPVGCHHRRPEIVRISLPVRISWELRASCKCVSSFCAALACHSVVCRSGIVASSCQGIPTCLLLRHSIWFFGVFVSAQNSRRLFFFLAQECAQRSCGEKNADRDLKRKKISDPSQYSVKHRRDQTEIPEDSHPKQWIPVTFTTKVILGIRRKSASYQLTQKFTFELAILFVSLKKRQRVQIDSNWLLKWRKSESPIN